MAEIRYYRRELEDPNSPPYEVGDRRVRSDGVVEVLWRIEVEPPTPNPYWPFFGDRDPSKCIRLEEWRPAATEQVRREWLIVGSEGMPLADALVLEGWQPPGGLEVTPDTAFHHDWLQQP